jgi:hypothetical protein
LIFGNDSSHAGNLRVFGLSVFGREILGIVIFKLNNSLYKNRITKPMMEIEYINSKKMGCPTTENGLFD